MTSNTTPGIKMYEYNFEYRTLIRNNNIFMRYYDSNWETITTSLPTEGEYLRGNTLEEVSSIPEPAWRQLSGDVEICFYTDDPNRTEVQFNVETELFTLADELENQPIKIIEYTDNPEQDESIITIVTEPFTFYDEVGDSFDVVYYTDDPAKTNAELEITANYSPLDEIDGDFEIVTWTNEIASNRKELRLTALPNPKMVFPLRDLDISGDLKKIIVTFSVPESPMQGSVKLIVSNDQGKTWKVNRNGNWKTIDITDLSNIKREGMSPTEINSLTVEQLYELSPNGTIRLAYYLEQNSFEDVVQINSLLTINTATIETPVVHSLSIIYDELDKKYSGLMFMDTNQQYYTTSVGEILKYLDMGTMIAGQTSLDIKILLTNTYPFNVENIQLWAEHNVDGLEIQLSKTNNPFISEKRLVYDQRLNFDEILEFYVRLTVDRTAQNGGSFDIRVSADPI